MPLAALQREFLAAMQGGGGIEARVRDTGRPPAAAIRVAIYRNAVRANQRGALAAAFPVVEQLVGTAFFNEAADQCLARHPSTSGDLHDLGAALPGFLGEYSPAAALPYLGDLALLEWALDRAFHAADGTPITVAALADVPADALDRLVLVPAPGCALIESPWPILALWRAHQPGGALPDDFSLDQGGETVAVYREGFECVAEALDPARAALLSVSLAGRPLASALDAPAFASTPDPGGLLMTAMGGVIGAGMMAGTRLRDVVE
ncbi:MAG: putative DNA-binding domain-containing protein [Betaproteobacteria bacterium]|nr:putative DNA-binding domain-containing protein [Betaproteobacteria bacterium]